MMIALRTYETVSPAAMIVPAAIRERAAAHPHQHGREREHQQRRVRERVVERPEAAQAAVDRPDLQVVLEAEVVELADADRLLRDPDERDEVRRSRSATPSPSGSVRRGFGSVMPGDEQHQRQRVQAHPVQPGGVPLEPPAQVDDVEADESSARPQAQASALIRSPVAERWITSRRAARMAPTVIRSLSGPSQGSASTLTTGISAKTGIVDGDRRGGGLRGTTTTTSKSSASTDEGAQAEPRAHDRGEVRRAEQEHEAAGEERRVGRREPEAPYRARGSSSCSSSSRPLRAARRRAPRRGSRSASPRPAAGARARLRRVTRPWRTTTITASTTVRESSAISTVASAGGVSRMTTSASLPSSSSSLRQLRRAGDPGAALVAARGHDAQRAVPVVRGRGRGRRCRRRASAWGGTPAATRRSAAPSRGAPSRLLRRRRRAARRPGDPAGIRNMRPTDGLRRSKSARTTRWPRWAIATARFDAVVVLPSPAIELVTASTVGVSDFPRICITLAASSA